MKLEKIAITGALALAIASAVAPTASSFPTGSAGTGDGREIVIIDNNLEISDLNNCWASGFPRDIRFDNRSSRDFLVYPSADCSGAPSAVVAPHTIATFHGWSARAAA
ncbi:hypothetical protein [Nocardia sp. NBC_01329]|uniref:hypothetical protein n=1 Tax=Nocardia sp. NBC_01329 TaxID=2903594 RepID=UPI002E119681|nr:hypothetical protein OG405_08490 [Nocardia sp. NBC_01329]